MHQMSGPRNHSKFPGSSDHQYVSFMEFLIYVPVVKKTYPTLQLLGSNDVGTRRTPKGSWSPGPLGQGACGM